VCVCVCVFVRATEGHTGRREGGGASHAGGSEDSGAHLVQWEVGRREGFLGSLYLGDLE